MSDLDLARRVLAGDESAAEALFTEYFPRLYRFARLRLDGNDDAAEEVAQTTMILAVRKLHTYRGEAALFTWMCTLCRRQLGARLGHESRHAALALVEDHPDVRAALEAAAAMAGTDPESSARRHEMAHLVQATLDQLPTRYGQALEWRYIQGLAVDEIATRLDLSYKAAESVLSRARQAFRDAFAVATSGWPAEPPTIGRQP